MSAPTELHCHHCQRRLGRRARVAVIAGGIQLIHTSRFLPPTAIFMHPRRWGWLLSLLDDNQRPLFIPQANGLFNAAGILERVESQQIVVDRPPDNREEHPAQKEDDVTPASLIGTGGGARLTCRVLRRDQFIDAVVNAAPQRLPPGRLDFRHLVEQLQVLFDPLAQVGTPELPHRSAEQRTTEDGSCAH
ncbi:MAG: hypothetical protein ACLP9Y_27855, partial [Mycobacterium sp.]